MFPSVRIQAYLIPLLLLSYIFAFGQQPLSKIDKTSHLTMLKKGVLLIRLSDQDKKIAAMQEQGLHLAAADIKKEQSLINAQIAKAFQKHFDYCTIYFIDPQDTKTILKDRNKAIKDIITGESIDLSQTEHIYVTDYGYGHPTEGFERYNRKGFQIFYVEEGKITSLGRDLFYAGVKQGFFSPDFEKSLQKTIFKLNTRLHSGNKYIK